jgi:hypothetical protein
VVEVLGAAQAFGPTCGVFPQAPEHRLSFQLWRWCIAGPRRSGSEVPMSRWSKPPVALSETQAHSSAGPWIGGSHPTP